MKSKFLSSLKTPFNMGAVAVVKAFKKHNPLFSLPFLCSLILLPASYVFAEDLFKTGQETVKDTFGKGSTVVWILYVLEILAAVFAYIKTKNLAVFGGIAAVSVFVNVVFGLI
ncbi:type IV conjugative transfer system pilin TraA (plasmid) [Arsenophonus sp. aPb]|uniref:type IV conjugative transfer system pilin TraA n=1 Tax=Arsenophonus sp. aPb TaxID=3041619 RepID=UPI00246991C7|nr:type IV conjugative transfer system pilin TraA [Arsenophonus sp. aPb]WGL99816.1 type IV conjugative transfer system pilin TraA [Arsenophonus sp. aPb]